MVFHKVLREGHPNVSFLHAKYFDLSQQVIHCTFYIIYCNKNEFHAKFSCTDKFEVLQLFVSFSA